MKTHEPTVVVVFRLWQEDNAEYWAARRAFDEEQKEQKQKRDERTRTYQLGTERPDTL